jgi:hypothetical protein
MHVLTGIRSMQFKIEEKKKPESLHLHFNRIAVITSQHFTLDLQFFVWTLHQNQTEHVGT